MQSLDDAFGILHLRTHAQQAAVDIDGAAVVVGGCGVLFHHQVVVDPGAVAHVDDTAVGHGHGTAAGVAVGELRLAEVVEETHLVVEIELSAGIGVENGSLGEIEGPHTVCGGVVVVGARLGGGDTERAVARVGAFLDPGGAAAVELHVAQRQASVFRNPHHHMRVGTTQRGELEVAARIAYHLYAAIVVAAQRYGVAAVDGDGLHNVEHVALLVDTHGLAEVLDIHVGVVAYPVGKGLHGANAGRVGVVPIADGALLAFGSPAYQGVARGHIDGVALLARANLYFNPEDAVVVLAVLFLVVVVPVQLEVGPCQRAGVAVVEVVGVDQVAVVLERDVECGGGTPVEGAELYALVAVQRGGVDAVVVPFACRIVAPCVGSLEGGEMGIGGHGAVVMLLDGLQTFSVVGSRGVAMPRGVVHRMSIRQ